MLGQASTAQESTFHIIHSVPAHALSTECPFRGKRSKNLEVSETKSKKLRHMPSSRFPPSGKDHLDIRLGGNVNNSFAEEDLGAAMFHRDHQVKNITWVSGQL